MIVSRALVEKNEIFPAFQTLFKQISDADEHFTVDDGKDLNGAVVQ